ncbi:MAG: ABC transporter ATP-binding protein [Epsilonproteobacteria bacterium]|nr:ABC transporter ATP-binding protein [Campylobacterota bacterium]
MNVVEVKDLVTKFGEKIIHDNISFEVKEKSIFGILGGSGSGKSVLLKEIIMLIKPFKGKIYVLGKDIWNLSLSEALELKKKWGVLFQFGALFTSLRVAENIALPLKEYTNFPQELIDELVVSKLNLVGLNADVGALYPNELSGGMVKRAALARALILEPKILFLDEPTSGLDPVSARKFDNLITNLNRVLGVTVIMITHDLDSIFTILDEMIVLYDKKIVAKGNLEQVLESTHPFVEEFFKNEYTKARYLECITK